MQPKIIQSLIYFKITLNHINCNMFQPSEAILRQLFTSWNCHTASHAIAYRRSHKNAFVWEWTLSLCSALFSLVASSGAS
jgi:hypothetical protein